MAKSILIICGNSSKLQFQLKYKQSLNCEYESNVDTGNHSKLQYSLCLLEHKSHSAVLYLFICSIRNIASSSL